MTGVVDRAIHFPLDCDLDEVSETAARDIFAWSHGARTPLCATGKSIADGLSTRELPHSLRRGGTPNRLAVEIREEAQ